MAQHLPLDLLVDPSLLSTPGLLQVLGVLRRWLRWLLIVALAERCPVRLGKLPLLISPLPISSGSPLWADPPQVAYGATILSFLGGVHWGLAMTNVGGELGAKMNDQRYLWSVLPCLMAWPTLAMPVPHAAGIQVRQGRGRCWLGALARNAATCMCLLGDSLLSLSCTGAAPRRGLLCRPSVELQRPAAALVHEIAPAADGAGGQRPRADGRVELG